MSARVAIGVTLLVGAVGCESVSGVDVNYRNGSAEAGGGGDDGSAGDAATDRGAAADGGGLAGEGGFSQDSASATTLACGCDASPGVACCVPPGGQPVFCSFAPTSCAGLYLACAGYDPTTDSQCCWNGAGRGAFTAYSA